MLYIFKSNICLHFVPFCGILKSMKKWDKIFIGAVVAAALLLWGGMTLLVPKGGGVVTVTIGGELFGEYSLAEERVIEAGDGNVLEISGGKVRMIEADCPDQLCIRQRALDYRGIGSIICLPNQVVVEIKAAGEGPDAVAG